MNNPNRPGGVIIILLTAVAIVAALSLVPWGKLTGNLLKDFNLLGDLFPSQQVSYQTHEELDPELDRKSVV